MSVRIELVVPKRLYEHIERKAKERNVTIEELLLLAINLILRGEGGGSSGGG